MKSKISSINNNIKNDDMASHAKYSTENEGVIPKPFKKTHEKTSFDKKDIVFLTTGIVGLAGGIACLIVGLMVSPGAATTLSFSAISADQQDNNVYSDLTGEKLADSSLKDSPVYCMQTPNGTDGARPQSGLTEAGVVFEAIAEAGITRFAAIYQNPSTAVIGPIRSLRIYFLDWDTPFDCTIVHAGGAENALDAVSSGGYKDLSEDYAYMYRGTYSSRLWNNLFTTPAYLSQFSTDHGYNTSNVKGFTRMTPEESNKARIDSLVGEKLDITKSANGNVSELQPKVTNIAFDLGGWDNFNVRYTYDVDTNTYFRGYESGAAHEVYQCEGTDLGEQNPEDVCSLTQVNPSVVVAMVVQEGRDSDGYHESIDTVSTGDAYIFQNGIAIEGSWSKSSRDEQIKFFDENGKEVALAPGQTFITAVPAYGSVEY